MSRHNTDLKRCSLVTIEMHGNKIIFILLFILFTTNGRHTDETAADTKATAATLTFTVKSMAHAVRINTIITNK